MTDIAEALRKLPRGKQTPTPPPGYLTVKQVANGAGVTSDVVKKWRASGRFPNAIQPGGTGSTHPWFIPEGDVLAAAGLAPSAIDPTTWAVEVGCKGVVCAACHSVLIPKRKGSPILTATQHLTAAVADHLTTCPRAQET